MIDQTTRQSGAVEPSITWHAVGTGSRAHAFANGDLRYAYCGVGPGEEISTKPKCVSCERHLRKV